MEILQHALKQLLCTCSVATVLLVHIENVGGMCRNIFKMIDVVFIQRAKEN